MPPQKKNSASNLTGTNSTVNRQMEVSAGNIGAAAAVPTTSTGVPSSNPRRRLLRTRFANRTKVYLVPAISEYTDEEFVSTWTTDEDTKANQAGLVRDIKALRNGAADCDQYCPRGLEHMRSSAHMERRKINKDSVTNAVFGVQDVQFESDVYDEEEIRRASVRHSPWARDNAEVMAGADAAYVRLHVRAEVDAFLREHYRQQREAATTEEGGGVGGKDGDDNDHLTLLQSALEVSDSENSTGSAGNKRSHLFSSRSRSSSPSNRTMDPSSSTQTGNNDNGNDASSASEGNKVPRTGGVDMFLNRISSRFNSAGSGPNKLATPSSARISLTSVTQSRAAVTTTLNGNGTF